MDKDKLHRALAHIAAGADKMAQAANIIAHGMKNDDSPARIAKHLADYGLLAEDLPEPCIYPDTGEHEWHMEDGYVSVEDGIIHVIHDETNDDNEPDALMPDWAELRFSTTTKGRETAYSILAACKEDLTDAAIYEVAKHIHRAYDGSMSYIHPNGETYIITVRKDQYAKF